MALVRFQRFLSIRKVNHCRVDSRDICLDMSLRMHLSMGNLLHFSFLVFDPLIFCFTGSCRWHTFSCTNTGGTCMDMGPTMASWGHVNSASD